MHPSSSTAGRGLLGQTAAMGTEPALARSTGLAWATAVAGIVAFSFSAMLYKLSGAPPAVGAALRFAYAGLFLALLAWRAGALRPGPGFASAAAAGVIVGVEVVIWNLSLIHI